MFFAALAVGSMLLILAIIFRTLPSMAKKPRPHYTPKSEVDFDIELTIQGARAWVPTAGDDVDCSLGFEGQMQYVAAWDDVLLVSRVRECSTADDMNIEAGMRVRRVFQP